MDAYSLRWTKVHSALMMEQASFAKLSYNRFHYSKSTPGIPMRRTYLYLLGLMIIAFALRVGRLDRQELRGDEAFSWNYVQGTPAQIVDRIIREGDPQPPLHYWLLWGWTQLNGDSEYALRFPSVFLSLLLVPLMYQVGRKLWHARIGLVAATITAVHPQQIWLAQDARNMYVMALVFILMATWLLPDLLVRRERKYGMGYVVCGLVAMFSHYYALFALLAHGGYVIAAGRRARRWITAGLLIAALSAPWTLTVLPTFMRGQLTDPGHLSLLNYTTSVFGDLAAGPVFPQNVRLIIAIAFGLVALLPLLTRFKWRAFLIGAIAVPFIGIYAIIGLRSTFNSYYFIFAFPAAYTLLAGGLLIILQWARPVGVMLIAMSIITGAIGLSNHYLDERYSKTRGWRAVAAQLAAAARPGDGYLANFPDPVQGYYLRHLDLPYRMLPTSPNFTPAEIDTALQQLNYSRIWFVPIKASQWDRAGDVQDRLSKSEILIEDHRFDQTRLMLFVPPDQATPVDAHFSDGINLIGYALTPDRLTLVWRATAVPATDYTVFVHALGHDGSIVAQHDAAPATPTSTWQPGQVIIDVHEFAIPADRPVTLVAGMYRPSTAQRLTLNTPATLEPDAALISQLNEK